MREHFEASLDAIAAVEGPMSAALRDRQHQLRFVYDRLSELQQTLDTEIVSLLSIAVGFSDTDGDSMR